MFIRPEGITHGAVCLLADSGTAVYRCGQDWEREPVVQGYDVVGLLFVRLRCAAPARSTMRSIPSTAATP